MSTQESPQFVSLDLTDMPPEEAVSSLIRQASDMNASDLFFFSNENEMTVSVRQWGIIRSIASVSHDLGRQYISLVKASAGMDIAERRRPLDGRWIYDQHDKRIDLRINCLPTLFGEDVSMRLLERRSNLLDLDQLGLSHDQLNNLLSMLSSPSGLILVTGPTGTGKTTTLYSCIQKLNDGKRKINTLEDPIEYSIEGVRQSQINPKIDIHFPQLLRSILRQAPDIIMVGEIRDGETASTAVRAASSGHLVLATVHAPIAAGAVQSMIALGVHRHFLASSLVGVLAQRLVRTLCSQCRIKHELEEAPQTFEEIQALLGPEEGKSMFGPGSCDACFQTGYDGRSGLFELMTFNRKIRKLVAEGRPTREIEQEAIAAGMVDFHHGSLIKIAQGVTSTEEIFRSVPTEYLGIEE